MLTVFTEEYGIVKAVSYGVKNQNKAAASKSILCYGDFDFYKGVGKDIMTINNIDTLDGFYPVSEDIKNYPCAFILQI